MSKQIMNTSKADISRKGFYHEFKFALQNVKFELHLLFDLKRKA
jgi:hypothetical protein